MINLILITCIALLVSFIVYKYYLKPIKQIKRCKDICQSLGYSVYQQPFAFLGISFVRDYQKGKKDHDDAMYYQRTVYSQVDLAIGNIFNKVLILFVNPHLIKDLLSAEKFQKYPKFQMLSTIVKETVGNGLVLSEGEIWKNKKIILSKVFNFELIKSKIPKISQLCNQFLEKTDKQNLIQPDQYKYNVFTLSAKIFNGVIMTCLFGCDQNQDKIQGLPFQQFVPKIINEAFTLSRHPLVALFGKNAYNFGVTKKIREIKEGIKLFRAKVRQIIIKKTKSIEDKKQEHVCHDLIQALVYQKIQNKDSFSYDEQSIIDEFSTFIIAGTGTTSRFVNMMIYFIGKYPEINERLRKQIGLVIKSDEDITYQNLKKLVYIDWLQYETTRFYGPFNGIFLREASEDSYILNLPILKGTIIGIQPRGNHFNDKIFKDPQIFRPERWQNQCTNIHPFAFLGFSGGPRTCIGKQLAHLQSKILLVKLIRRYRTIQVPQKITMTVTSLYEPLPYETVFQKNDFDV